MINLEIHCIEIIYRSLYKYIHIDISRSMKNKCKDFTSNKKKNFYQIMENYFLIVISLKTILIFKKSITQKVIMEHFLHITKYTFKY